MKKHCNGQTLSEYSLAGLLIAVVAISGLGLLGGNIGNLFSQSSNAIGSSGSSKSMAAPAARAKQTSIATGQHSSGGTANTNAAAGQHAGNMPGTTSQDLAGLSTPSANAIVQTAGSMGDSTKVLADMDQLSQLADKYQASDPALYNQIVALANAGKAVSADIAAGKQSSTLSDLNTFTALWNKIQGTNTAATYARPNAPPPLLDSFSQADQQLLTSLTTQSQNLASNYTGASLGARGQDYKIPVATVVSQARNPSSTDQQPNAAVSATVQKNSKQTMQCSSGVCIGSP